MPSRLESEAAQRFVQQATFACEASGAAVWRLSETAEPRLLSQWGLGDTPLDIVHRQWPGHTELVTAAGASRSPKSLTARFEVEGGQAAPLRLILWPLPGHAGADQVLELFFPEAVNVSLAEIEQRLAPLFSKSSPSATPLASGQTSPTQDRFQSWLAAVHRPVDLEASCQALADETRVLLQWDRVSLFSEVGRSQRLMAISGLPSLDRRSGAARELQQLITDLGVQPRLLVASSQATTDEMSPAERRLTHYLSRVTAAAVAVAPLTIEHGNVAAPGVLVAENFSKPPAESSIESLPALAPLAGAVLARAQAYERSRTPLLRRWWRTLTRHGRRLVIGGLAVIIVAGLATIPVDLNVSGTGRVTPEFQRDVYPTAAALVEKIFVQHGQQVAQGAPLVQLRSTDLEFELARTLGELATVQQQIQDLATLQSNPAARNDTPTRLGEWAAKSEELKAQQIGLQQQVELLRARIADLLCTSPLAGTVLTWDIEHLLVNRPIARTDRLLTVATLDGPWRAILEVDPRDLAPVRAALLEGRLTGEFVTADAPETSWSIEIGQLAPAVSLAAGRTPMVPLEGRVAGQLASRVRPETTVQYKLLCGRAPAGRVWFRRWYDRLRAWVTLTFATA